MKTPKLEVLKREQERERKLAKVCSEAADVLSKADYFKFRSVIVLLRNAAFRWAE
jgi:hypothetical protein